MNSRNASWIFTVLAATTMFTAGSARAGDFCGDDICGASEDSCNCPIDCERTSCSPCDCGSGQGFGCFCDSACVGIGDCCSNACDVCGYCPPVCGENGCEIGEDCFSCPLDCGECTGACCQPDNTAGDQTVPCQDTTNTACQDAGGIWHGPFSSCGQGSCEPRGACCFSPKGDLNVAGGGGIPGCTVTAEIQCVKGLGGEFLGVGTFCELGGCNPERVDISTKGSLLIFSDVELEWTQGPIAGPGGFNITKDTVISLTNDYPGDVYVQMYFINGDPERDAVFTSGPLPVLISEQEPGCNWVDCQVLLTPDQSVYWSAASGNPVGCQPFGILDPDLGNGPGRPNPEVLGGPRVLRGYIVAWAVNADGVEIHWNHLSGKATIVDYAAQAAWEYSPWAFQALFGEHGFPLIESGFLALDGFKYANAFDMLLFDFFAAGSMALSSEGNTVSVDTDLTLHPVSADLRQETFGPVTTKAHFDIWNMNERKLSNTRRCITCWDQVLLSQFGAPNNFLLMNLQSDKGKARIDGKQADECDVNCIGGGPDATHGNQTAGFLDDLLDLEFVCSDDAALLGVAAKILRFGDNSIDYAGSELVGMGTEPAFILYDIVGPPGTLRDETYNRLRPIQSKPARIGGSTDRK